MKKLTTLLTVLVASAGFALAQEPASSPAGQGPHHGHGGPGGPGGPGGGPRRDPEAIFKKLDTNGDGNVSLEEFKASPRGQKDPARAEARFKTLDTNNDGNLSLEEFKAGHKKPEPKP